MVNPIRRFLGNPIHIISQEKSGSFFDHLNLIGRDAPNDSLFVPGDRYIKEEVQYWRIYSPIPTKEATFYHYYPVNRSQSYCKSHSIVKAGITFLYRRIWQVNKIEKPTKSGDIPFLWFGEHSSQR